MLTFLYYTGLPNMMIAGIDKEVSEDLAAAKAYGAGVIRHSLYDHLDERVRIPLAGRDTADVTVREFTAAIADVINKTYAKSGTLSQPLVDDSGTHLANLTPKGKLYPLESSAS